MEWNNLFISMRRDKQAAPFRLELLELGRLLGKDPSDRKMFVSIDAHSRKFARSLCKCKPLLNRIGWGLHRKEQQSTASLLA